MHTSREIRSTLKLCNMKAKALTPIPKKLPTYIVALALKETYDDLVIAQQMICKQSSQESIDSITPTNSIKLLESVQGEKLEQISDETEYNNNDIKRETLEKNVSIDDQKKLSSNESNEDNMNPKKLEVGQPQIIFNATNYNQKYRESKFIKRKPKSQKKINAIRKIHKYTKPKYNQYECTMPKNTLNNRLEKYYDKAKQSSDTEQIPRRILKKVLAKENLLEETEPVFISNKNSFNDNDSLSLSTQASKIEYGSFSSSSSRNTIKQRASIVSSHHFDEGDDDGGSAEMVRSAIRIASENVIPYKNDVINVAVAVAYKKSKVCTLDEVLLQNEEKFNSHLGLTSTETITVDLANLTSQDPLDIKRYNSIEGVIIDLKPSPEKKRSYESEDETYDMARTSSDFNELNNESTCTLKNEETLVEIDNLSIENDKEQIKRQTLLQTVISLGYYPEVTPSTSSAADFDVGKKNVIRTECTSEPYSIKANQGDNDLYSQKLNVFQKQYHQDNQFSKNFYLPNEANIKAMLNDNEIGNDNRSAEKAKRPSSIPELWDKLTLTLDVTFKRLEDTITNNIIKEIRNTFKNLEQNLGHNVRKVEEQGRNELPILTIEPPSNKVISAQKFKQASDTCLQCDLIQNNIIDQIMMKISSRDPKIIEPSSSTKSMERHKTLRDYFEVLKSPTVLSPQIVSDKGDTVTISTNSGVNRIQRLKIFLTGPVATFFRENMFVITSVPAFFVMLLFVYSLLLFILKPW